MEKTALPSRVLVFTGDGKGKTTAALGMVVRAAGHGLCVRVAQFFKTAPTGELAVLERLPGVTVLRDGCGFVRGDLAPHRAAARRLWVTVSEREAESPADLLVLDELGLAVAKDFVDEDEVLALLARRPCGCATVLTGRGVTPGLLERADTVTEMVCVKHGCRQGYGAQNGVEQ